MNIRSLLSISICLIGTHAISDSIKVSIVYEQGSYRQNIPGDVRLYKHGRELTNVPRVKRDNEIFEFELSDCEEGMTFRVIIEPMFLSINNEFYPCESPEMEIAAKMPEYLLASQISGTNPNTVSTSSTLNYSAWLQDAIQVSQNDLVSMGSTATYNQSRIIEAMVANEFGKAAYYANENAAIARRKDLNKLSVRFSTLAYDAGFRAMGIDPAGGNVPLLAIDPQQNSIPVPTQNGQRVLKQYNTQVAKNSDPTKWDFGTTSSLLAKNRANAAPLIKLETLDELLKLEFDPSNGTAASR